MTVSDQANEVSADLPSGASDIRDAACVVLVDRTGGEPKFLMGRRHASQVFLPDKWVFPGGRVDEDDRRIASGFGLTYQPPDLAAEIRAFAVAAVRELEEETGFVIGSRPAAPDFEGFCTAHGFPCRPCPHPARLRPLARAITPPGRVRRYDTWFFLADAAAAHSERGPGDGELLDLAWFTMDVARRLDLPNITRLILDDLARHMGPRPDAEVPFYWPDSNGFRRTYISCRKGTATP